MAEDLWNKNKALVQSPMSQKKEGEEKIETWCILLMLLDSTSLDNVKCWLTHRRHSTKMISQRLHCPRSKALMFKHCFGGGSKVIFYQLIGTLLRQCLLACLVGSTMQVPGQLF